MKTTKSEGAAFGPKNVQHFQKAWHCLIGHRSLHVRWSRGKEFLPWWAPPCNLKDLSRNRWPQVFETCLSSSWCTFQRRRKVSLFLPVHKNWEGISFRWSQGKVFPESVPLWRFWSTLWFVRVEEHSESSTFSSPVTDQSGWMTDGILFSTDCELCEAGTNLKLLAGFCWVLGVIFSDDSQENERLAWEEQTFLCACLAGRTPGSLRNFQVQRLKSLSCQF